MPSENPKHRNEEIERIKIPGENLSKKILRPWSSIVP